MLQVSRTLSIGPGFNLGGWPFVSQCPYIHGFDSYPLGVFFQQTFLETGASIESLDRGIHLVDEVMWISHQTYSKCFVGNPFSQKGNPLAFLGFLIWKKTRSVRFWDVPFLFFERGALFWVLDLKKRHVLYAFEMFGFFFLNWERFFCKWVFALKQKLWVFGM